MTQWRFGSAPTEHNRAGTSWRCTLGSGASDTLISRVAAPGGSAERIERSIFLREVLAQLTHDERLVCVWKFLGFSSQEIARRRGTTVNAVDMLFFHAKHKIRRTIGAQHSEPNQTAPVSEPRVRAAGRQMARAP